MKPGAFTRMYVQLVFAVKCREALLTKNIQSRVFEYISGILTNMDNKSIIVNGTSNHIHILFGLKPSSNVSDIVHDVKRNSTLFINKERLTYNKFSWQEGYGGFTYSRSQIDIVYNYIFNQESHHEKITFHDEYVNMLIENEIDYDEQFLFDNWEDSL
jgi:putative transposase